MMTVVAVLVGTVILVFWAQRDPEREMKWGNAMLCFGAVAGLAVVFGALVGRNDMGGLAAFTLYLLALGGFLHAEAYNKQKELEQEGE